MTRSPKHLLAFLFCFISFTTFAQNNTSIQLKNGNTYTGDIKNGVPHGNGSIIFQNGDRFTGELVNGEIKNGSMKFSNRNEYLGEFRNGKMNGQGAMILSNGDSYKGSWKDGEAHGLGSYKRTEGSEFTGKFANGMRNGEGYLTWSSKDTLFGNWVDDKLNGNTTFKFANNDQLTSTWKDGGMKVNATYTTTEGEEINGSMNLIYMVATLEDTFKDNVDVIKDNLQLATLSSAMEFKAARNYDMATDFFMSAQKYAPSNMTHQSMIASQLKEIEVAKNNSGWARLPKK